MVKYIVRGNTFPLRKYLKALDCVWNDYCRVWTTEKKDLKKLLKMLQLPAKQIRAIKLEKIIEETLDSKS